MPIETRCPTCEREYTLADDQAGKRVRCRHCADSFTVPGAPVDDRPRRRDDDDRPRRRDDDDRLRRRDDDDRPRRRDDDDRPRRRRYRDDDEEGNRTLLVFGIVVVMLLLLVGGGVALWLAMRPSPTPEPSASGDGGGGGGGGAGGPRDGGGQVVNQGGPREPADLKDALQRIGDKQFEAGRRKIAAQWVGRQPVDARRQAEVANALALALAEPFLRDDAAAALEKWATDKEVPDLIALVEQVGGPPGRSAMNALIRLKDARALPVLAKRLANVSERANAEAALRAWGKAAEKEVLPYLNHQDQGARQSARALLDAYGTDEAARIDQTLADLAAAQPRSQAPKVALETLATLKVPAERRADVVRAIGQLLGRNDLDFFVQEAAARAAGEVGGDDLVPALERATETARIRKDWYTDALARIKSKEAIAALIRLMLKEDAVSMPAQAGLKKVGPEAEAPLVEVLTRATGPDRQSRNVRVCVIQILGEIGTRASIPAIQRAGQLDPSIPGFVRTALTNIQQRP
jgi:predicted Zn finger-like uncharacterized protein